MTPEIRDEIIDKLCDMSNREVDQSIKPRLQALKGRSNDEIKDELLGIIDDVVYAALAGDFVVQMMHVLWLECGGTELELERRNRLLKDDANIEELRSRFKWKIVKN